MEGVVMKQCEWNFQLEQQRMLMEVELSVSLVSISNFHVSTQRIKLPLQNGYYLYIFVFRIFFHRSQTKYGTNES